MNKILFLPRWYPSENDRQNGVFIQKHAQAAALHNEVAVLYAEPSASKNAIEEKKTGNLTEVIVYYKSSFLKPISLLLYTIALYKGWKKITQSGFFPNLTHVHVLNRPALLALWLKWKHNVPFIISEHWSGYVTGKFEQRGIASGLLTALAIKQAAFVTVVSETLKAGMLKCGLKADYRILPNVVEVLPDAWKQKLPDDKFRYLVVADLRDDIKNISGVIRAFKSVYAKDNHAELILAGDGPDRKHLEDLVSTQIPSLQEMESVIPVKFLGRLSNEDVLKLIPTAHAVIINSRIETFSVVTLEAIFSGRPVISTRCGGPEQFINEQNGILIEKENEAQLADAMQKMKFNYSGYSAEKVRRSIPEKYGYEEIAQTLSGYYQVILEKTART